METIIYFYQNRNAVEFVTEKWKEDDYCLIRAGVPPFVWKKERAGEREKQKEQGNRDWRNIRLLT